MTDTCKKISLRRRAMHRVGRILKWTWLIMTIGVSVMTVLSAFGGCFNPEVVTWPALIAMAFPILILLNCILGFINLCISKKAAIVQWGALLCSTPALCNWCPLHPFASHKVENESNEIQFMSYNTFGFVDDEGLYPDSTNRTASAIINSGADIICLQEVGMIVDMPTRSLLDEQIDSINNVYPYFSSEEEKMVSILSKYPMRDIDLEQPVNPYAGWQAAEVYVGNDTILVVSVHLQSFGLNDEDKLIYHRITSGSVDESLAGTRIIYNKLTGAMRSRAQQARKLRHQLDSLNYKNVILSGDFNDIAGCYAMRQLLDADLKSVYHEIGNGPVITYHSDGFLFNIDHTLYRGNVRPVKYRHGKIKSSDHYPLYITFETTSK